MENILASPSVMATMLIGISVVGGGMLWYNFSTAYEEVEEMTDLTPLVTRMQQANEENIKKFDATLSDGQGGKLDGSIKTQKIISGEIIMPRNTDLSTSVLYVALLDDAKQNIDTKFIQGDIILPTKNSDTVAYSIPVDFEFDHSGNYVIFAFLDVDNDYMNNENDLVKIIPIEKVTDSRIQYFDFSFS